MHYCVVSSDLNYKHTITTVNKVNNSQKATPPTAAWLPRGAQLSEQPEIHPLSAATSAFVHRLATAFPQLIHRRESPTGDDLRSDRRESVEMWRDAGRRDREHRPQIPISAETECQLTETGADWLMSWCEGWIERDAEMRQQQQTYLRADARLIAERDRGSSGP